MKVSGISQDILHVKANALAGKIVLNSSAMVEAIIKHGPLTKFHLADHLDRIYLECLGLNLEIASRVAFGILKPQEREIFCDGLNQSVFQLYFMDTNLSDGSEQQTLVSHLNEAQNMFEVAKKLFSAPGEPPRGTLLWQFAKYLGLEVLKLPEGGTIHLYEAICIRFGTDSANMNIPGLLKI